MQVQTTLPVRYQTPFRAQNLPRKYANSIDTANQFFGASLGADVSVNNKEAFDRIVAIDKELKAATLPTGGSLAVAIAALSAFGMSTYESKKGKSPRARKVLGVIGAGSAIYWTYKIFKFRDLVAERAELAKVA